MAKRLTRDSDPYMIGYFHANGINYKLNELIKLEVENIALDYYIKHGVKPSKILIRSWITRFQSAYHKGEITRMVIDE